MSGDTRTESDAMGEVAVPADRHWGAQTQRSLHHFSAGGARFTWGRAMVESLGLLKGEAARANAQLGLLDPPLGAAIAAAADDVASGRHDDEFPLVVFQTGSGTQTNMNANEVVANLANVALGAGLGARAPVHPNDHVNLGQSSNDTFPTVMHLATGLELHRRLFPATEALVATLRERAEAFHDVVKVGRTHLQDAAPVTLGQEVRAWADQIAAALNAVRHAAAGLEEVALGGTAVGTGLNTDPRFAALVCEGLSRRTGLSWRPAANPFVALASHDAMVATSAALRTLAGALWKMANDVRWLASGPRAGIGELSLPANEPGSSIMPGKVNPTQAEALLMVAVQVFGNDAAVALAGTQGNFQLNAHKPVIAHNVLESIDLLASAVDGFDRHCAAGIEARPARIAEHLAEDLMLVTALVPHIGYDAAAAIAHAADRDDATLRDAAIAAGVAAADYDRWVDPAAMAEPVRGPIAPGGQEHR